MWDEPDEEDWSADENGFDEDAEDSTVTCPECGGEMHHDAEMCRHCGYFLEDASHNHPLVGKPGWFVILGILGVLATLAALLRLF